MGKACRSFGGQSAKRVDIESRFGQSWQNHLIEVAIGPWRECPQFFSAGWELSLSRSLRARIQYSYQDQPGCSVEIESVTLVLRLTRAKE
jgi:hypothetical protein